MRTQEDYFVYFHRLSTEVQRFCLTRKVADLFAAIYVTIIFVFSLEGRLYMRIVFLPASTILQYYYFLSF